MVVSNGTQFINGYFDGYSITSETGILQVWPTIYGPSNKTFYPYGSMYICDSQNLTNIVAIYEYQDRFVPQTSFSGSFFLQPNIPWDSGYWFQFVARIKETKFSNCNNENYVHYADTFGKSFILNATANSSGNCLNSILLTYVKSTDFYIPSILYISSLNYTGPSSVKVLSTIYNVSIELFEFSEEDFQYWHTFAINGSLINFIIPPNGSLDVKYEAWESVEGITNLSEFEDYGCGVVKSVSYPLEHPNQNLTHTINCTKGFAKIIINLVHVDVPFDGYLLLIGSNQTTTYRNGTFKNETIEFNSDDVFIDYNTGNVSTTGQ